MAQAEQVALLSMECKSVLGHSVLDSSHEFCVRPLWNRKPSPGGALVASAPAVHQNSVIFPAARLFNQASTTSSTGALLTQQPPKVMLHLAISSDTLPFQAVISIFQISNTDINQRTQGLHGMSLSAPDKSQLSWESLSLFRPASIFSPKQTALIDSPHPRATRAR